MKILMIFLFFGFSTAHFDYSFEEYLDLASAKKWPKDEATFISFLEYCSNPSSSQATDSEGDQIFTKADCLRALSKTIKFPPSITKTSYLEPIYDGDNVYYTDIISIGGKFSENC